jgi:endoglucanase
MTRIPPAVCGIILLALSTCAAASRPKAAKPTVQANRPARYGKLQVVGTDLCDSYGKPVQLRGMSTMGLQWYGGIVNDAAFAALAKDWKADVVRLAMYPGEGGYVFHPELKQLVWQGVELAMKYGMYAIVDWQMLTPGNPNDPVYSGAQAFFDEASKRYGKVPNVLYEIMSEPNGPVVWAADLKPYAEKIVATIRANDADNPILIGSGTWSQDVDIAAADPVQGKNLMYAFHFYAGTHGQALRDKVQTAIDRGVAVFASEWGTSQASGTGGTFLPESEEWLAFLDRHMISWTNWSFCDNSQTSSALVGLFDYLKQGKTALAERESLLVPETMGPEGYPIWSPEELTASGAFVRAKMRASRH